MYARKVDLALHYAEQFIGTFYSWGGDDSAGFDCSGFCIEVLKAVGLLPRRGDWRAVDLYNLFKSKATQDPTPGCLTFYGRSTSAITHVELVLAKIGDTVFTIGASGGGSNTKTKEDAIRDNAFIKVRPMRGDLVAVVNPFWEA